VPGFIGQAGKKQNLKSSLAKLFEDACPNCLQISRRFFRVSMGILKSKMVFKSVIIIINYCIIIIIHASYNSIINAQYNYYISNKGLLEACNREENVKVTAGPTISRLKRRL
jgi:hypothetical protein